MPVNFLGLVFIILAGLFNINLAFSQPDVVKPFSLNAQDLIEETFLHPAGPTIRREWWQKSSSVLYRIEIDRSRSGQMVFDGLSLIHTSKSGWRLVNAQQKEVIKITSDDIASKKVLHFQAGVQQWDMFVRGEDLPVILPGIATENENSMDITLIRTK